VHCWGVLLLAEGAAVGVGAVLLLAGFAGAGAVLLFAIWAAAVPHVPHQIIYGAAAFARQMQFPVVIPCWHSGKQFCEEVSQ